MFVVITGGSRGIGKALAYRFAKAGYNLILTCEKNENLLLEIKDDIKSKYNKIVCIKKGLLEEKDIIYYENEIGIKIRENVYMLINNAGKCDYNLLPYTDYEKYKEVTYANLDYAFLTTKLILPYLIKNKQGIVVNITSMWGIFGASCEVIYSMTKAGLIGFTKALAKEEKNTGIDIIAFALGAVDTDMCKNANTIYGDKEIFEKGIKEFVKTLDGGRMFTTDEIAEKIYNNIINKKYNSGDIIELNNGLK